MKCNIMVFSKAQGWGTRTKAARAIYVIVMLATIPSLRQENC